VTREVEVEPALAQRPACAAGHVLALEHGGSDTLAGEVPGGRETGQSGADDDDLGHLRVSMGTRASQASSANMASAKAPRAQRESCQVPSVVTATPMAAPSRHTP
jgi:hypothetical protein